MVEWHHRLNEFESEQAPGKSRGQGSLHVVHEVAESDMTEQQQAWNVMMNL